MSLTLNGNFGAVYQPDAFVAGNIVDADQSVASSTTLVTVPQLTVPIGINERIILRYTIQFNAGATGDLKYFVDAPSSPTLFRQAALSIDPAGAVAGGAILTAESNTASVVSTSAGGGLLLLNVIVANGSTQGQVTFQFAQNSSDSTATIVRAGSLVEYRNF
jgi:hypothetical protein